jgi:hypothetical protein
LQSRRADEVLAGKISQVPAATDGEPRRVSADAHLLDMPLCVPAENRHQDRKTRIGNGDE